MRKMGDEIVVSFTLRVLLLSILFFAATYFFIGENIDYMSKTQDQMNQEIVALLNDGRDERGPNPGSVARAMQKAGEYNVGIAVTDAQGITKSQPMNENVSLLRFEIGGSLVTREFPLDGGRGGVVLTYFRPFFADDGTTRFWPASIRMGTLFTVLSLIFSWVTSMAAAGLFKKDIKKVRAFAANLVKGSYVEHDNRAVYAEIQAVLNELNALRDVIVKKEQLKKRMTADLAHELRTPLTTLQSHLEALIDGVWKPTTERFVSCHEEILRLIRLVGDIEKLSRLEDENVSLEKSRFDLTELARNICLNFQGKLGQKNITLTFTGEKQNLLADRDKISQVMVNLLSNSLKYTARGGRVLVDIEGDRDHVYLVINDSGAGIPVKDIHNVFDRFYRSDASRTRATGGAGIGLAIARSIVEAHRGSIDVTSQEGLGTEVTVIIPRQ